MTELKHYGVLGMKWGVHRAPEFKKLGTRIKRTTTKPLSKNLITRAIYTRYSKKHGVNVRSALTTLLYNDKRLTPKDMTNQNVNRIMSTLYKKDKDKKDKRLVAFVESSMASAADMLDKNTSSRTTLDTINTGKKYLKQLGLSD